MARPRFGARGPLSLRNVEIERMDEFSVAEATVESPCILVAGIDSQLNAACACRPGPGNGLVHEPSPDAHAMRSCAYDDFLDDRVGHTVHEA